MHKHICFMAALVVKGHQTRHKS